MISVAHHALQLACLRDLCRLTRQHPERLTASERAHLRRELKVTVPRLRSGDPLCEELVEGLVSAEVKLLITEVGLFYPRDDSERLNKELETLHNRLLNDERLRALVRDGEDRQAKAIIHRGFKRSVGNGFNSKRCKGFQLVTSGSTELSALLERAPHTAWGRQSVADDPSDRLLAQESAWRLPSEPERLLEVMASDEALKERGGELLCFLPLSVTQRKTWSLKYLLKWRSAEIAEHLEMSVAAVNMSNHHAKRALLRVMSA